MGTSFRVGSANKSIQLVIETAKNYSVVLGDYMANVKQGNLTKSPQWWKHLKDFKRFFWKAERKAQQKDIKGRLYE